MVRGLGTARRRVDQGHKIKVRRMDDPVQRKKRPPRRKGRGGRQDHKRCRKAPKTDAARVFVEIAKDHRRSHGMAPQSGANCIKLTATRCTQQAQMDSHHPQRRRCVQIDDHRTAGFMSRQIQSLDRREANAGAGQKGITVPSQTDGVPTDRQRLQPGCGHDAVARQSGRSVAQSEVRFLQGNDIRVQIGDPGQHALGVAAQVRSQTRPYVPGCDAQGGL